MFTQNINIILQE